MVRIDCHLPVSAALQRTPRISATELSGNSNCYECKSQGNYFNLKVTVGMKSQPFNFFLYIMFLDLLRHHKLFQNHGDYKEPSKIISVSYVSLSLHLI